MDYLSKPERGPCCTRRPSTPPFILFLYLRVPRRRLGARQATCDTCKCASTPRLHLRAPPNRCVHCSHGGGLVCFDERPISRRSESVEITPVWNLAFATREKGIERELKFFYSREREREREILGTSMLVWMRDRRRKGLWWKLCLFGIPSLRHRGRGCREKAIERSLNAECNKYR